MNEAKKKGEKSPSPDRYNLKTIHSSVGGHIGVRLKTEPIGRNDKNLPAPTAYNLSSIEMANSSSFFVSNFKFDLFYLERQRPQNTITQPPFSWTKGERKIKAHSFVRKDI